MRSIVCHKVGIDELNHELGRALEHADVCDLYLRAATRSYSSSKYDIPKAQGDLLDASLLPAKRNLALFKDRLDVILEVFLLSTNTPMA